jgi:hypothetical protein
MIDIADALVISRWGIGGVLASIRKPLRERCDAFSIVRFAFEDSGHNHPGVMHSSCAIVLGRAARAWQASLALFNGYRR